MAATVTWYEYNGAGADETENISNLNLGAVDSANLVPADNPVVAGQNSFFKMIKVGFSGSFTKVSNFKLWKSAGAYKTGEQMRFIGTLETYTQPDQVSILSTFAAGEIPTSEPGSSNVGPAEITTEGNKTNYMALQALTTGATEAGAANTKTITFQYDEI